AASFFPRKSVDCNNFREILDQTMSAITCFYTHIAGFSASTKVVPFQNIRFRSLRESGHYERRSNFCASFVLDLIAKAETAGC
ncbi:MAG: hypothetical protein ABSE51_20970, partial [Terracidiphilus sp.]